MTQASVHELILAPAAGDNPRNSEAAITELADGSLLVGWTEFYAASGADRWKARGHGMGSLIWADGLLIVLSDKGRLALVKADPSGYSELAGAQVLDGLCWTAPSLANGRAYLRDMTQIVCLQLAATGD